MIRGLFVLLLFQCLGELIKLATGTVLAGPVIGLLLLFAALALCGAVPEWLGNAGSRMISQLALLLLPPSVGLFFLGDAVQGQWPAIIGAVVLGTVLTLLFSAALMQWLLKLSDRKRAP